MFSCFSRGLWASLFGFFTSSDSIFGHPWTQFGAKVGLILLSCRQTWFVIDFIVVHLLHTNFKVFLPPLLRLVDVKNPQVHSTRPGGMREAIRRPSGRRAEYRAGSSKFFSPSLASISVFHFFHIFPVLACLLPPP